MAPTNTHEAKSMISFDGMKGPCEEDRQVILDQFRARAGNRNGSIWAAIPGDIGSVWYLRRTSILAPVRYLFTPQRICDADPDMSNWINAFCMDFHQII